MYINQKLDTHLGKVNRKKKLTSSFIFYCSLDKADQYTQTQKTTINNKSDKKKIFFNCFVLLLLLNLI